MRRVSEECARCLRRVIFASEEERLRELLLSEGEFLCKNCKAGMKEDA
ncbi:MAG: hypothetical protein GX200_01745 [Firmicutes bacterium]|nr:hypothetical protein [Bacillota bacterium]